MNMQMKKYTHCFSMPCMTNTSMEVYAQDITSAEKALVEKMLEDIRWQLIKQVSACEAPGQY